MSIAGNPSDDPAPIVDVLAAPEVRRLVHRMTVSEYQRLSATGQIEEATELIRGVVIDKISESPLHAWVTEWLADWLREHISSTFKVREGHPIALGDSQPQPDVCVVPRSAYGASSHPSTAVLAIEVAITSEKLDQQKALIYAEAGIAEYWLVYAKRQTVVTFSSPRAGRYDEIRTRHAGETLRPHFLPESEITVAEMFPEQSSE